MQRFYPTLPMSVWHKQGFHTSLVGRETSVKFRSQMARLSHIFYFALLLVVFPFCVLLCPLLLIIVASGRGMQCLLSFIRGPLHIQSPVGTKRWRRRIRVLLRRQTYQKDKRLARQRRHTLLSMSPRIRKTMAYLPSLLAFLHYYLFAGVAIHIGLLAIGLLRLLFSLLWLLHFLLTLSCSCFLLFILYSTFGTNLIRVAQIFGLALRVWHGDIVACFALCLWASRWHAHSHARCQLLSVLTSASFALVPYSQLHIFCPLCTSYLWPTPPTNVWIFCFSPAHCILSLFAPRMQRRWR